MLRPLAALSAVLLAASASADPAVLRVSAIPDEAPTELQRKFKPLGDYLAKQLGMEVKFIPVTDYPATVEGLASGQLDLVWYGGFTFVQARRRTGTAIPLVQREEDARFHSKFITRPGSGIEKLADLKGKNVAFGSPSSTSGHLMPRWFLLQAGVDPDKCSACGQCVKICPFKAFRPRKKKDKADFCHSHKSPDHGQKLHVPAAHTILPKNQFPEPSGREQYPASY